MNILHASVSRNLTVPHKFYCLTDDVSGLNKAIATAPIPDRAMVGNGPKIFTFSDGFLGLGPDDYVVSLDLDIVVVGELDFLAENPEVDFVIAKHRSRRSISRGHGAVYRLRVGTLRHVWDRFIENPQMWAKRFPGKKNNRFSEQRWLEHLFTDKPMSFFPANKILIFRNDCSARSPSFRLGSFAAKMGLTTAFLGRSRLPGLGESVVSFSGATKPWDVISRHNGHLKQAPFVATHWRL